MIDDAELLRRYAEDASEEAFAELVRRHLPLVYAAAWRQVGEPHRAEDVTQMVFTDLARKASSLRHRSVLISWLYTATHHAAAKVRRTEQRRQAREQEAHVVEQLLSDVTPPADWERIRPVLDEAMNRLPEDDRAALLLRFFQGESFAGIGAALRLTEEAARKRVERALDKLHGLLAAHGITSTAAALTVVLANQPAVAVPAGLATSAIAAAFSAATAKGGALTLLRIMSMTKFNLGLAGLVLAAGATGLVLQQRTTTQLRGEIEELRQQTRENPALRAENQRLTQAVAELPALQAEHAELVQLRAELAALKAQKPSTVPASARSGGGPAGGGSATPAASAMVPVEAMGNAGRATPRAAGQTEAWAVQHGDVETAASLITFNPAERAKMEAVVAALPDNLREQYGTPEKLMAMVMAGTPRPIAAVQVLDEKEQGPDDYVQHIELKYADGRTRTDELTFHRDADGWKRVVSPATVDRVITALKNGPPPRAAGQ
ncbi:MAG TPA: sigma-70 family RNA polymerase sigma factor [Opitutaceae bacterium]|nr:sigma-70 family RNA polymerase sigma factor [Opitutaceae bacterium]